MVQSDYLGIVAGLHIQYLIPDPLAHISLTPPPHSCQGEHEHVSPARMLLQQARQQRCKTILQPDRSACVHTQDHGQTGEAYRQRKCTQPGEIQEELMVKLVVWLRLCLACP